MTEHEHPFALTLMVIRISAVLVVISGVISLASGEPEPVLGGVIAALYMSGLMAFLEGVVGRE